MTSLTSNTLSNKNQRKGRWTKAESNHFQQLLEKYGKNWKEIQPHLKGRTLSQIRSHAQKFFAKVGPKMVASYERRANLLFAEKVLAQQKCFEEEHERQEECLEQKQSQMIMMNENESSPSSPSAEDQTIMTQTPYFRQMEQSELMKEQTYKSPVIKEQGTKNAEYSSPILSNNLSMNWFIFPNKEEYSECTNFGGALSNFRPFGKCIN